MALTVEDGTGLSNSDSYISVAEATGYHSNRGNVKWTYGGSDTQEVALRVATESVDMIYGDKYLGEVWKRDQALLFPRSTFYDNHGRSVSSETIPQVLKDAVAEAALLFIEKEVEEPGSGRSALIQNPDPSANVKSYSEDYAGAFSESYTYFSPVSTSKLRVVGMKLYPILRSGGSITVRRG